MYCLWSVIDRLKPCCKKTLTVADQCEKCFIVLLYQKIKFEDKIDKWKFRHYNLMCNKGITYGL